MSKKINVYHLRTVDTEKTVNDKVVRVGGRPYATVAIEINEDGTVNRGVSICSAKDAFVKKVGVNKAIGRLESAKKHQKNILAIESFDGTQKRILKKIGGKARFVHTNFNHLGAYRVAPTADEVEIFKNEFKN